MNRYESFCSTCDGALGEQERCGLHPLSGVFMKLGDVDVESESHDLVWFCKGCHAEQPERPERGTANGMPACVACGKRAGGYQDCAACRRMA